MDRYTALQVFRHVAELSSFAEAGRKLGLSPAAISKNVAELEASVGTRLINRTTRRMALTDEGKLYLEHVVRGLDALKDADAALSPVRQAPGGTLRVAAPMTVTLMRLSSVIPEFMSRYPDLRLDLHLDDRRVDIVQEGFDLAIRGSDKLEDSSLIARKLAVMPHVVCAAPAYFQAHGEPLEPADLKSHNCIRFSLSGHADLWEFRKGSRAEKVTVKARYSVTSSLAVRDALRAGFGLSLIPYPYVEDDLKSGRLQRVLPDWETVETTLYAIYPSRQHVAPKIRAFLDFLAETFNRP
ncbi:LysR family transcriptional regulator [Ensifer adhaerens]|uniref:LysR family transcriptional regulator n=1 Tax=Ensifer adhaerens TaxID=106592 RepID=UPI001CC1394F|nr:LysR family transcriptional regulator [Ensifer adhaerens]MBZ7924527.1 LysR family transcriptional regulator [Ensifer adhaerens]UAX96234.1 LysR family transcriptional regulator [Ensifer adhaerens]UAY04423.1 LysR family transcriptional regulator [Ensifer adhaerens]UAY09855.1 LysR family transcriptional regulator [Ensifer adhaerens]